MTHLIRDVLTRDPVALSASDTVRDAAQAMKDSGIGDVIVLQDGVLEGIVTDRDITVRAIAMGKDPDSTPLKEIVSTNLATVSPEATVDDAIKLMREKAIRRVPVVEFGRAVGIVSLGDLALELDRHSVLADVSAAPPNA
jgi:CBS domain-containing protein